MVVVVESMGRAMLGTPLISSTLASQLLVRADSGPAIEDLLAEIASGSIATVAMMENEDWGNPGLACRVGEDGRLSGTKKYVVDGSAAGIFVASVELIRGVPSMARPMDSTTGTTDEIPMDEPPQASGSAIPAQPRPTISSQISGS